MLFLFRNWTDAMCLGKLRPIASFLSPREIGHMLSVLRWAADADAGRIEPVYHTSGPATTPPRSSSAIQKSRRIKPRIPGARQAAHAAARKIAYRGSENRQRPLTMTHLSFLTSAVEQLLVSDDHDAQADLVSVASLGIESAR